MLLAAYRCCRCSLGRRTGICLLARGGVVRGERALRGVCSARRTLHQYSTSGWLALSGELGGNYGRIWFMVVCLPVCLSGLSRAVVTLRCEAARMPGAGCLRGEARIQSPCSGGAARRRCRPGTGYPRSELSPHGGVLPERSAGPEAQRTRRGREWMGEAAQLQLLLDLGTRDTSLHVSRGARMRARTRKLVGFRGRT